MATLPPTADSRVGVDYKSTMTFTWSESEPIFDAPPCDEEMRARVTAIVEQLEAEIMASLFGVPPPPTAIALVRHIVMDEA
jgi:hypothetical protein